MTITQDILDQCKMKLLQTKADLLNQGKQAKMEFQAMDKVASGDEADQTMSILSEHTFLINQERIRNQLFEVELALSRIERGIYGLCEETEDYIEKDRLLAIPWTRLSIEGAEIREEMGRRFAR